MTENEKDKLSTKQLMFAPVRKKDKNDVQQVKSTEEQNRKLLEAMMNTSSAEDLINALLGMFPTVHPLLITASMGHVVGLQKVLQVVKGSLNEIKRPQDGNTALHLTTKAGHVEATKLLLESGADPTITDNDGNTAFMLAIMTGSAPIVNTFWQIRERFDINQENKLGETAIHMASERGWDCCIHMLLASGICKNKPTAEGRTALMICAMRGDIMTTKRLAINGTNILMEDNESSTSICLALKKEHNVIAEFLFSKLDELHIENYVKRRIQMLTMVPDIDESYQYFHDVLYQVFHFLFHRASARHLLLQYKLIPTWVLTVYTHLEREIVTGRAFVYLTELMCIGCPDGAVDEKFVEQFLQHGGTDMVLDAMCYYREAASDHMVAYTMLPLLPLAETSAGKKWLESDYYKIAEGMEVFHHNQGDLDYSPGMEEKTVALWKKFSDLFSKIQTIQAELHGAELLAIEERDKQRQKVKREKKREKKKQKRHKARRESSFVQSEDSHYFNSSAECDNSTAENMNDKKKQSPEVFTLYSYMNEVPDTSFELVLPKKKARELRKLKQQEEITKTRQLKVDSKLIQLIKPATVKTSKNKTDIPLKISKNQAKGKINPKNPTSHSNAKQLHNGYNSAEKKSYSISNASSSAAETRHCCIYEENGLDRPCTPEYWDRSPELTGNPGDISDALDDDTEVGESLERNMKCSNSNSGQSLNYDGSIYFSMAPRQCTSLDDMLLSSEILSSRTKIAPRDVRSFHRRSRSDSNMLQLLHGTAATDIMTLNETQAWTTAGEKRSREDRRVPLNRSKITMRNFKRNYCPELAGLPMYAKYRSDGGGGYSRCGQVAEMVTHSKIQSSAHVIENDKKRKERRKGKQRKKKSIKGTTKTLQEFLQSADGQEVCGESGNTGEKREDITWRVDIQDLVKHVNESCMPSVHGKITWPNIIGKSTQDQKKCDSLTSQPENPDIIRTSLTAYNGNSCSVQAVANIARNCSPRRSLLLEPSSTVVIEPAKETPNLEISTAHGIATNVNRTYTSARAPPRCPPQKPPYQFGGPFPLFPNEYLMPHTIADSDPVVFQCLAKHLPPPPLGFIANVDNRIPCNGDIWRTPVTSRHQDINLSKSMHLRGNVPENTHESSHSLMPSIRERSTKQSIKIAPDQSSGKDVEGRRLQRCDSDTIPYINLPEPVSPDVGYLEHDPDVIYDNDPEFNSYILGHIREDWIGQDYFSPTDRLADLIDLQKDLVRREHASSRNKMKRHLGQMINRKSRGAAGDCRYSVENHGKITEPSHGESAHFWLPTWILTDFEL